MTVFPVAAAYAAKSPGPQTVEFIVNADGYDRTCASLRREYLRLDGKAADLRGLIRAMGGSPELRAESERLTLRARAAYAAYVAVRS